MNERIRELMVELKKTVSTERGAEVLIGYDEIEAFAELIVKECMEVARQQRNPSNLNYKPSERFVEDLQKHFGVKE